MSTKYFAVRFNDGRSEITQSPQRKEVLNNTPYEFSKIVLAKGFNSYIDAVLWLQDPQHFPPRKQFFAVKTGRRPGLYYTQEDYDINVLGYPSAEGMSFYTEKAAKDWLGISNEIPDFQPPVIEEEDNTETEEDSDSDNWISDNFSKYYSFYREKMRLSTTYRSSDAPDTWMYCQVETDNPLIIYTDASCRENTAGYAAVIIDKKAGTKISIGGKVDGISDSTGAELYAIISALKIIDSTKEPDIEIWTDSQSLVDVIKSKKWERFLQHPKPWAMQADMNLWQTFYDLTCKYNITIKWVKAHSRSCYNTRCDIIAGICSSPYLTPEAI